MVRVIRRLRPSVRQLARKNPNADSAFASTHRTHFEDLHFLGRFARLSSLALYLEGLYRHSSVIGRCGFRVLGVFSLAVVICLVPAPLGVQPRAWHLLAIFVATSVGIILKPLPMGAIAMIGVAATALSGTLTSEYVALFRM